MRKFNNIYGLFYMFFGKSRVFSPEHLVFPSHLNFQMQSQFAADTIPKQSHHEKSPAHPLPLFFSLDNFRAGGGAGE